VDKSISHACPAVSGDPSRDRDRGGLLPPKIRSARGLPAGDGGGREARSWRPNRAGGGGLASMAAGAGVCARIAVTPARTMRLMLGCWRPRCRQLRLLGRRSLAAARPMRRVGQPLALMGLRFVAAAPQPGPPWPLRQDLHGAVISGTRSPRPSEVGDPAGGPAARWGTPP